MDANQKNVAMPSENSGSWESRLKRLREQRPQERAAAQPAVMPEQNKRFQPGQYSQAEKAAQRQVLAQYLYQWADEHNRQAEQHQEPESDSVVLLEEDWLNAQTALQGEVGEAMVVKTATVWTRRQNAPMPSENGHTADEGADTLNEAVSDGNEGGMPVSVNVLEPAAVPQNRPVLCLSESELLERLTARLLPHLTDAVNGMVRTAIQRQTAHLTYQLQKSLSEETPELVREILAYNLQAAFGEIKYNLKTKK